MLITDIKVNDIGWVESHNHNSDIEEVKVLKINPVYHVIKILFIKADYSIEIHPQYFYKDPTEIISAKMEIIAEQILKFQDNINYIKTKVSERQRELDSEIRNYTFWSSTS